MDESRTRRAADVAGQFPELVSRLEPDDTAIAELVAGERDVFVAACDRCRPARAEG